MKYCVVSKARLSLVEILTDYWLPFNPRGQINLNVIKSNLLANNPVEVG